MDRLREGLLYFGIKPTEKILAQFAQYEALLRTWNEQINLTAITAHTDIIDKHFVDSIACQTWIPKDARVADVGTGAGFPGLPLQIVRADISVTLIDSLQKRLAFLDAVIEAIGVDNAKTLHMRAEDAGHAPALREGFDAVCARAVAELPVLCEYCLPLVKTGGVFLALKGPEGEKEAKKAEKAVKILGGEIREIHDTFWQETSHTVIEIQKIGQTPAKYPRKAGKPQKSPLLG